MRFRFIWIGKTRDRLLLELEDGYLKRLEHFIPTERIWVPELKKADGAQLSAKVEREAKTIERKLKDSYVIVLDGAGKQFSSEEMANLLAELMNRATAQIDFVVGGYWGVPETVRTTANLSWSLGKLTLPHELARVVVLEQVYRSMSIIRSLPYHK